MRKTHTEPVEIEKEIIDVILCDLCGTDMWVGPPVQLGGIGRLSFGYGSTTDLTTVDFDICNRCAKELIARMKTVHVDTIP